MDVIIHCKYDELVHDSLKNRIKPLKIKMNDPVEIELDDQTILINKKFLPLFTNFSWYILKGNGQTNYLMSNILIDGKKRTIGFHQMIQGIHENLEIDHINGNGLENRIENLRIVTHQINQANQRKRRRKSTSRFFGVSWCKRDSVWQVHAVWKNKRKNIGRFKNEIEAAIAYNNYLIKNNIPKALNNV